MSEPNDTAQEGFDQLKRNLEVRYPEDSDLSLDEFLNVESLLALAVRVCGPGADPRKADRLLSNYQLIRPETIGADGHLMQMARRHLFSLASSTAWRRLLGLYERAEYERYRFFDIANGGMALREHPLTGIDRMPIYIDRLLGDVKLSHKNVVARPKGRYSYTCKPEATGDTTVTGSIRWVTIPDAVPPQFGPRTGRDLVRGRGLFICASMSLCVRAYVQWCWCVYMRVRVCASAYVCRCADMHPDRCAGDLYGKTGAGLA